VTCDICGGSPAPFMYDHGEYGPYCGPCFARVIAAVEPMKDPPATGDSREVVARAISDPSPRH
jgi:hypothetical protein